MNLNVKSTSVIDNGNWIGLVSDYQTTDGTSHVMADVWFVADRNEGVSTLQSQVNGMVDAIAKFGTEQNRKEKESQTGLQNALVGSAENSAAAMANLDMSVGLITDALRQFDACGNPQSQYAQTAGLLQSVAVSAVAQTGSLPRLQNLDDTTIILTISGK
jgi:hypothetical protein